MGVGGVLAWAENRMKSKQILILEAEGGKMVSAH